MGGQVISVEENNSKLDLLSILQQILKYQSSPVTMILQLTLAH